MSIDLSTYANQLSLWTATLVENFLPKYIMPNLQIIIQIILILVIGYIIGKAGKAVATKILSVAGLKRITAKSWTEDILKITGYKGNIVELIGDLVKWCIYIITLAAVVQVLGFTSVAYIFNLILMFVPKFIVAILVIVVGFIIADFFGKVFEEATIKIFREEVLGRFSGGLIKYSVSMVALVIALSLIGLDVSALLVLFGALLAIIIIISSFGLKDLIPNFTAGMQLRSELKVGQKIRVKNYSGRVSSVGVYSVELDTGKRIIRLPNSMLIKEPFEKGNGKK